MLLAGVACFSATVCEKYQDLGASIPPQDELLTTCVKYEGKCYRCGEYDGPGSCTQGWFWTNTFISSENFGIWYVEMPCDGTEPVAPEPINELAKTPPMGWNSWNVFGGNINETQIKEIADVMVSSGMRDAGYIYLNLDDNWMAKKRDANGNLTHDPDRFPSGMKALGDYIHSKGLKFGIYGDHGLRTCIHSDFPEAESGSYMKEEQDAKTFASWGVDYLKYDNCNEAPGSDRQKDYERMRDALNNSGRDIVFSICAWGFADWMPTTGNLWRISGDIENSWKSVAFIIEQMAPLYQWAGPGRWNDPDMLQVGNGVLTNNESRTQMTLWAMVAAPLLTGNDIRKMTDSVKAIYMNTEMIAVDQDSAGIPGYRILNSDGKQIWVRPLGGENTGNMAVALYNSSDNLQTIDLKFSDLGVSGAVKVRDIWKKKDLGILQEGLSSEVEPHHVTFLKISTDTSVTDSLPGSVIIPDSSIVDSTKTDSTTAMKQGNLALNHGMQTSKVQIFNAIGKLLRTLDVSSQITTAELKSRLKTSGLAGGMYLVRLSGQKMFWVKIAP